MVLSALRRPFLDATHARYAILRLAQPNFHGVLTPITELRVEKSQGHLPIAWRAHGSNAVCMSADRMRLPVHPLLAPESTIDVHDAVVRAIERELELRFSGNSVLNRLEAEAQLAALLRDRRDSDESRKTREKHHDVRGA